MSPHGGHELVHRHLAVAIGIGQHAGAGRRSFEPDLDGEADVGRRHHAKLRTIADTLSPRLAEAERQIAKAEREEKRQQKAGRAAHAGWDARHGR